ncbi:MAG: hypothetical protein JJT75_07015 [Opitutales bacterium]|nr:hypothetical protein [Opitutales bacterium]MCH8539427.1 hypothetical protein [Opitutales bacterium]
MNSSRITALYYDQGNVSLFLKKGTGRPLAGDLLVEINTQPGLAYALGLETPRGFPGIIGLLSGMKIADLQHQSSLFPAPLIPAPGPLVNGSLLTEAICHMRTTTDLPQEVSLLIPYRMIPVLGPALLLLDQHAILLDTSLPPHRDLTNWITPLQEEGILSASNFLGLFSYQSNPAFSDEKQQTLLRDLLAAKLSDLAKM